VLRYGAFYGPGTSVSADPEALLTKAIRKRRFPIIGGGGGVWSFVHIEDAASATVAAVDKGGPGIYNVVDDEPAPVREWLPFLAEQLGAKKPTKVPRYVARLLAGKALVLMMTEVRARRTPRPSACSAGSPAGRRGGGGLAAGRRADRPGPRRRRSGRPRRAGRFAVAGVPRATRAAP
jgi:2-alkyl-3-oxoalkanoate reductase